jgi:hypothetical protein
MKMTMVNKNHLLKYTTFVLSAGAYALIFLQYLIPDKKQQPNHGTIIRILPVSKTIATQFNFNIERERERERENESEIAVGMLHLHDTCTMMSSIGSPTPLCISVLLAPSLLVACVGASHYLVILIGGGLLQSLG